MKEPLILRHAMMKNGSLKMCAKACDLAVKYGNTHIRAFADVDSKARLEGVKGVIRGREEYKDRLDIQVVCIPTGRCCKRTRCKRTDQGSFRSWCRCSRRYPVD